MNISPSQGSQPVAPLGRPGGLPESENGETSQASLEVGSRQSPRALPFPAHLL